MRGALRGLQSSAARVFWPTTNSGTSPPTTVLTGIQPPGVCVTGLRLRGPTRDRWAILAQREGIVVQDSKTAIIDHNDLSDWIDATVNVYGPHPSAECPPVDPTTGAALQPNPMGNVQVLR